VRHAQHAPVVVLILAGQFAVDAVAGATPTRTVGIAPLHHKVGNDAVKRNPVVKARFGQFHKISDRFRGVFLEEFDNHCTFIGTHFSFFHAAKVRHFPKSCVTSAGSVLLKHKAYLLYYVLMSVLFFLWSIIVGFLAFNVSYLLLYAIAGRLGQSDDVKPSPTPSTYRKIAVLIPAYKEDAVILDSVRANLRQDYPADRFDLVVIADSLRADTLAQLAGLPIWVVPVSFEKSTVTKAINAGLAAIATDDYAIVAVSDADNHMAPDFLSRINAAFGQGWRAVQGHRVAKNTQSGVALLDAISEEINNHIFRKGVRALGLSSALIGSGMAFDHTLMRAAMNGQTTTGGYDKELEMNLLLGGHQIAYLEQALIYDEKVASAAVFQNQRTRWIAAQWQFLVQYFGRGMAGLAQGNVEGAFKIIQTLVLPRVLLLGLLGLMTMLGVGTGQLLLWAVPLSLLLGLTGSLLLAVPAYLWKQVTMRELLLIPTLMFRFARAVLNIRKAFSSFMHTPHAVK